MTALFIGLAVVLVLALVVGIRHDRKQRRLGGRVAGRSIDQARLQQHRDSQTEQEFWGKPGH